MPRYFRSPSSASPCCQKGRVKARGWKSQICIRDGGLRREERGIVAGKDPLSRRGNITAAFSRAPAAVSGVGEGTAKGASHLRLPQTFSYCPECKCIQSCHYLRKKRKLWSPLCEGTHFLPCKGESGSAETLSRSGNTARLLSVQECGSVTPMVYPQGLIDTIAGFCYNAVERAEGGTSNEVTENAIPIVLATSPVADATR